MKQKSTRKKIPKKKQTPKIRARKPLGAVETMYKVIDADLDPFEVIPTGHIWHENPEIKHFDRFEFKQSHLCHMFSLKAKNFTVAEIKEQFMLFYLDWDKMKEIGKRKAAESRSKLDELKEDLELAKSEKNKTMARMISEEINAFPDISPSQYARDVVKWLKIKVHNVYYANATKWEPWAAEEHRLWKASKDQTEFSVKGKDHRMAVLDRLLDYEMSQKLKNTANVLKILEHAQKEMEGRLVSVKFSVEDVTQSIMTGTITRDDWVEVVGICQRMLMASVKGEEVQDIERLMLSGLGSDIIDLEAENGNP